MAGQQHQLHMLLGPMLLGIANLIWMFHHVDDYLSLLDLLRAAAAVHQIVGMMPWQWQYIESILGGPF